MFKKNIFHFYNGFINFCIWINATTLDFKLPPVSHNTSMIASKSVVVEVGTKMSGDETTKPDIDVRSTYNIEDLVSFILLQGLGDCWK